MAKFTITGPDGRSVTITAPDDAPPDMIQQKLDSVKSQWSKDGGQMSWSDVAGQALKNAPASAWHLANNIAQPFMHPIVTATAFKDLGAGALSKSAGALGFEQDPSEKAATEAPINAVGKFFADRYGGVEAIKNTLASDPIGALADGAAVLTGGGALAARAPGVVGQVGRVAGRVGSTIDPIAVAARTAAATGRGAGHLASSVLGMTTSAGKKPVEYGYAAGMSGNTTFPDHMRGFAPISDVGDMAKAAVSDFGRDRRAAYNAGIASTKASKTALSFNPVRTAVNDAYGMITYKGLAKSDEAAAAYNQIRDLVHRFEKVGAGHAEGFDALKQAVGEIRQKSKPGTLERRVADKIYNTIKDEIVKQVPEYAATMKGYSNASEQIDDISKTFSLGEKASKDTALRKLTSVMRNNVNTNYGQRTTLMDELATKQPNLPYAIAGQALNSPTPRGLNQLAASGAGVYGLMTNPAALAVLPAFSPRVVGEAAYAAGRFSRSLTNNLSRIGVTPDRFVNALRASNQMGNALSGIGLRYDEDGSPR